MKKFNAKDCINSYYAKIEPCEGNEYPRLKAWEFLWEYIWSDKNKSWESLISPDNLDTTALHLGFFLANWGMFRGSSKLLNNSNLDFMKNLVQQLFKGNGPRLFELTLSDFSESNPNVINNQKLLDSVIDSMVSLDHVSWTPVLKTKILLGIWGEFPALDRYYCSACKALFPQHGLDKPHGKTLTALHTLIEQEALTFPKIKTARHKIPYPTGRLLDMAFFQYGYDLEENSN